MHGRVLVIAGSDSGGGAGIQADIKTITVFGAYAATAITALTAQDTLGVHAVHMVPPEFVAAMRATSMRAGPDMSLSSMVPRPIDLGLIPAAAGETLQRFERWPIIPTLLLWGLFIGGLALIFRLMH